LSTPPPNLQSAVSPRYGDRDMLLVLQWHDGSEPWLVLVECCQLRRHGVLTK